MALHEYALAHIMGSIWPFLAFHTDFGKGWRAASDFAFGDYLSLAAIGIGIPLAVLILGCGAWWVAAGFKSKSN